MRIGGRAKSICHLKNALRKTVERAAAVVERVHDTISIFTTLSHSLSFDQVSKQTTKEKERKVTLHQSTPRKKENKKTWVVWRGVTRRYTLKQKNRRHTHPHNRNKRDDKKETKKKRYREILTYSPEMAHSTFCCREEIKNNWSSCQHRITS